MIEFFIDFLPYCTLLKEKCRHFPTESLLARVLSPERWQLRLRPWQRDKARTDITSVSFSELNAKPKLTRRLLFLSGVLMLLLLNFKLKYYRVIFGLRLN